MELNTEAILQEILALDVPPTAKEAGAALVEAWITEHFEEDQQLTWLAVEMGFFMWLDARTLIIGVQDAVAQDSVAPFGCEWKSAKEPKKNRDGRDSAWWNEEKWLNEISRGPQLAIYALALNRGTYVENDKKQPIQFNLQNPRIRVRAAVKSNPVRFWPEDPDFASGVYQFPNEALEDIKNGLLAKADTVRCARRSGVTPWQLTGKHCHPFGENYPCPLFADWCSQHKHPGDMLPGNLKYALFDPHDPAAQLALPYISDHDLTDPDLVIFSASLYDTASRCMELYRVISQSLGGKEDSQNLAIGSAMHAGLAAYHRQLRDREK